MSLALVLRYDVARMIVIGLFTAGWLPGVALGVLMMLFPNGLMRFRREFHARFNPHIHIKTEYGPD